MIWKLIAVCYISIMIIISSFFTPNAYNWRRNSISELAAQKYQNRWIILLASECRCWSSELKIEFKIIFLKLIIK